MTPLEAFDFGRLVGRAEKSAVGTIHAAELILIAEKARSVVANG